MRTKILIVDDAAINRQILCEIFKQDYKDNVLTADDGIRAVEQLRDFADDIAVVLLDLIMPNMDGFGVLETMQQEGWIKKIPVLMITGDASASVEIRGFEMGVADFIRKPFNALSIQKRVRNVAQLFAHQNELEDIVNEQTKQLREQYRVLEQQAEKLRETNDRILDMLGNMVEQRNLESGLHVKRVKGFTEILARFMMKRYPKYELSEESVARIAQASALHDIGKIAIPDSILLKPGRLTDEEFAYMKTHTTRGGEILNQMEGIWDDDTHKLSRDICLYHHERFDGRGYPEGLKGDEIPIAAQLVSVADVYDALVSERVYKAAFTKDEAFEMIQGGKCGVFSPELMECFDDARAEFEQLADLLKETV